MMLITVSLSQDLEALRDPESGLLTVALQWEAPGSGLCTQLGALMRQLEDTASAVGHHLQVPAPSAVCKRLLAVKLCGTHHPCSESV